MSLPSIPVEHDWLWPRDADHRYRLYARRGKTLHVLAAVPDPAGIGVALVTLEEDAHAAGVRLMDEGAFGLLDVMPDGKPSPTGRWLILPWHRPERSTTFGLSRRKIKAEEWGS